MQEIPIGMNTLYDLQLTIKSLDDDDYRYLATSPDLPNLIVVGDKIEEILALAPQVAASLIASMKTAGDLLPNTIPFAS